MIERFFEKVEITDTCWVWTGGRGGAIPRKPRGMKALSFWCSTASHEACDGVICECECHAARENQPVGLGWVAAVHGVDLADLIQKAESIIEAFARGRDANYALDASPEVWGVGKEAPTMWRGDVRAVV